MDLVQGLDVWFDNRLVELRSKYRPETIAYVVGVLKAQAISKDGLDLSNRSVVLEYADAVMTGDFVSFQRIGDWVLWVNIIMPTAFDGSQEAIESIGRHSYYSCHRILKGQWRLYEELADQLPTLALAVRHKLR